MNKKLLLIFFLAFIIRLVSINQSLWLDEATTARVVQEFRFSQIIFGFSLHDFHPPLYYLFMKLWTMIFDYSEVALRLPSVIFSLGTGWIVYLIGNKIDSGQARMTNRIGLWSCIFFLFNPLIMYYSQEARMYMMATFFLTTALYFYLPILFNLRGSPASLLNRGSSAALFLFSLFISLSFLTFYGSIFLIVPMFLYLVYEKRYKTFFISFFILNLSFLFILPLFLRQFENARESLQAVINWKNVLGTANLKNLLLIPLKFSVGRIGFLPKWLYWSLSGVWTVFIWFFVIKGGFKNKLLFILLLGSLGFGILFSFFTPLLQYFRFLYLLPIVSLLLALGIKTPIIRIIGVIGFIFFSLIYLVNPLFHREDWKSMVKSLPRDKQILMIKSSSDPLLYYRKDIVVIDLKSVSEKDLKSDIIVIPYTADIHGVNYKSVLDNLKFRLVSQRSFRGLMVEYWKKSP